MKIAFVYDRVNKFGGAERVLLTLHEIWPEAPLYTAVYNPKTASWASVFEVKSSFLQHLPFATSRHELYPILAPLAFETFDFSSFDVVLSITSAEAKGIITKTNTLHICYCLTPTRYLWSGYTDYIKEPGVGSFNFLARILMRCFSPRLRNWDIIASQRPDNYIAISQAVAGRVKKYYKRDSIVIYPPVDLNTFKVSTKKSKAKQDYFLIVSRLVPYKKIDYVISAFNRLGWKLIIIGDGLDAGRLKNMAKKNIIFVDSNLSDEKLCNYYQNCRALIFAGVEDFGLTSVEAQAAGRPVFAYSGGGVKESIVVNKTGELYDYQNESTLIALLQRVSKKSYDPSDCRISAARFSKMKFKSMMKHTVESLWNNYNKSI